MLKASPPHIGQHRPAARGAGKRVRVSLRTLTLASPSQAAERSPPERADRPLQGDVGVEGVMRPCRSRWQRCARCPGSRERWPWSSFRPCGRPDDHGLACLQGRDALPRTAIAPPPPRLFRRARAPAGARDNSSDVNQLSRFISIRVAGTMTEAGSVCPCSKLPSPTSQVHTGSPPLVSPREYSRPTLIGNRNARQIVF